MPQYKVLEKSYLPDGSKNNDGTPSGMCRIYEAGETVSYDGLPGGNLEPLDDEGKAKQADYQASLVKIRQERAASLPVSEDPNAFAEKVASILEDGLSKAVASMAPPAKGKG